MKMRQCPEQGARVFFCFLVSASPGKCYCIADIIHLKGAFYCLAKFVLKDGLEVEKMATCGPSRHIVVITWVMTFRDGPSQLGQPRLQEAIVTFHQWPWRTVDPGTSQGHPTWTLPIFCGHLFPPSATSPFYFFLPQCLGLPGVKPCSLGLGILLNGSEEDCASFFILGS